MKNFSPSPPIPELTTKDFVTFDGVGREFLGDISPSEALASITTDDLRCARVHPSGFWVIQHKLSPADRSTGQYRIHVWPSGVNRVDTDPHKHPWMLASKNISDGQYVEQIAKISTLDEDATHLVVETQHDPHDVNRIFQRSLGQVSVRLGQVEDCEYGEIHSLPDTEFHFTPVTGSMLVTLALMGPTMGPATNLKKIGVAISETEPRRPSPKEEAVSKVWQELQEMRERLVA